MSRSEYNFAVAYFLAWAATGKTFGPRSWESCIRSNLPQIICITSSRVCKLFSVMGTIHKLGLQYYAISVKRLEQDSSQSGPCSLLILKTKRLWTPKIQMRQWTSRFMIAHHDLFLRKCFQVRLPVCTGMVCFRSGKQHLYRNSSTLFQVTRYSDQQIQSIHQAIVNSDVMCFETFNVTQATSCALNDQRKVVEIVPIHLSMLDILGLPDWIRSLMCCDVESAL